MLNRQHQLLAIAVIASLGLSACGQKKDLYNTQPPATAQTQSAPKADGKESKDKNPTTPLTDKKSLGGGLGTETPKTEEPKTQAAPQADTAPKAEAPAAPQAQAPKSDVAPVNPAPSVVDVKPVTQKDLLPQNEVYDPTDATNVTNDLLSKKLTGGVTRDGLVYTSSSNDVLLDYLRLKNEKVDPVQRAMNLQAAASVTSASLFVDKFSGDALITVKMIENGIVKVYNLAGGLSADAAARVRVVRAGIKEITTGTRMVDGTIKCLDLDGGCNTTHVRLKVGQPGSAAIVNVVFRQSNADLYFQMPGENSGNPEYLMMRDMMMNTIKRENSENRITKSKMESFEVVNGRSGANLTLQTAEGELLAFSTALLAPEAGTGVKVPAVILGKAQQSPLDILVSNTIHKLNYANTLANATLVANNGLGQVKLLLKTRVRGGFGQDQFAITFMRTIKPIVEVNDDNLK